MNKKNRFTHVIDTIFPISVFFVFAASSLIVLLLAAHIYKTTTDSSTDNFDTRTSFAYVTEKIRQNDTSNEISSKTIDGIDYLLLENKSSGFTTYIYAYNGYLKELRIRENIQFSPDAGTNIVPLKDFSVKETGEHVFSFTFTDKNGNVTNSIVSERSSDE